MDALSLLGGYIDREAFIEEARGYKTITATSPNTPAYTKGEHDGIYGTATLLKTSSTTIIYSGDFYEVEVAGNKMSRYSNKSLLATTGNNAYHAYISSKVSMDYYVKAYVICNTAGTIGVYSELWVQPVWTVSPIPSTAEIQACASLSGLNVIAKVYFN